MRTAATAATPPATALCTTAWLRGSPRPARCRRCQRRRLREEEAARPVTRLWLGRSAPAPARQLGGIPSVAPPVMCLGASSAWMDGWMDAQRRAAIASLRSAPHHTAASYVSCILRVRVLRHWFPLPASPLPFLLFSPLECMPWCAIGTVTALNPTDGTVMYPCMRGASGV